MNFSPDFHRILKVPQNIFSEDDLNAIQEKRTEWARKIGWKFWDHQLRSILAYKKVGGLFPVICVGGGKTFTCLQITNEAFTAGLNKILLLVPPRLIEQLVSVDLPFFRKVMPVRYPAYTVKTKKRMIVDSGMSGLYIMSHNLLSAKDGEDILNAIGPKLIIIDECDAFYSSSARTRRLFRYIRKQEPQLCCLTATVTNRTASDYHRLMDICLKENSPLPRSPNFVAEVVASMEEGGKITRDSLVYQQWCVNNKVEYKGSTRKPDYVWNRNAYKARFNNCRGIIVHTNGSDLPALSIDLVSLVVKPNPELADTLRKLDKHWVGPNGDEIEHAIVKHQLMKELSLGFYHRRFWPEGTDERSKKIWEYKQQYHKELRSWLTYHAKPRLDTPRWVGLSMDRRGDEEVGEHLYRVWKLWKGSQYEGMTVRESEAEVIDLAKISELAALIKKLHPCIAWYDNKIVGKMLYHLTDLEDDQIVFAEAGKEADKQILKAEGKTLIASLRAHGRGKNLQAWNQMVYGQWPRSAKLAEQSLGRMHRSGQKRECSATFPIWIPWEEDYVAATINDALFLEQTTGIQQKLIYATYLNIPHLKSYEQLKKEGWEPRLLDGDYEAKKQQIGKIYEPASSSTR